jgi:hypothetical protein
MEGKCYIDIKEDSERRSPRDREYLLLSQEIMERETIKR